VPNKNWVLKGGYAALLGAEPVFLDLHETFCWIGRRQVTAAAAGLAVATDRAGNVYVTDHYQHSVRKYGRR